MGHAPKYIRENYEEIIPGVFSGVPNEVYHSDEAISCSNIKDIFVSLDQYELRKKYKKQTDSMIFGSAFHDLLLLPDAYHDTYVVSPYRTKTAKGYKAFCDENEDKVVISPQDSDTLFAMRDKLLANPGVRPVLTSEYAMKEVSIWAEDPMTGVKMKVRPDLIHSGAIYDLKTTSGTVEPRGAIQSVFKFKYHVQAAFYTAVCRLIGMTIHGFVFVFIETSPPYHTAMYTLNEDLVAEGEDIVRRSLDRYHRYVTGQDTWTGLEHGTEVVTL